MKRPADQQPPEATERPRTAKVLIVSYLFPPCGGVGVQRVVSYCKYLPANGCEVFVLTARNPVTAVYDHGLALQVPAGTKIYRTFTPELPFAVRDRIWQGVSGGKQAAAGEANSAGQRSPLGWLKHRLSAALQRVVCPDPQVFWSRLATGRALRILRKHGIDTVLVNAPPFSVVRVAAAIKRAAPQVRVITEFRDEWVGNHLLRYDPAASAYKWRVAGRMEQQAVEWSDYVVAVTPAQRQSIRARYPEQPEAKFLSIPNGYDPEAFRGFRRRREAGARMVVAYAGTIYGNPYYSPGPYLDAVDQLPETARRAIESRFIGRVAPDAQAVLAGRRSLVTQLGFLPQQEAFRQLEEADWLLLVAGDETKHAGKLFEYLATGIPILALTPENGEVARIVRGTASGRCVDPYDTAGIQAALLEGLERWRRGISGEPNWPAIRLYERPRLVTALLEATAR